MGNRGGKWWESVVSTGERGTGASVGGGTPSCLKAVVDVTTFVIRRVGSAAYGARRGMVTPTFNADRRSGAIGFGMSIGLAPDALNNGCFLPRGFNRNPHVA